MRKVILLAMLALSACDFVPKLSDNRSDVPEAGTANATPAVADDRAAEPAAPPTPAALPSATASPVGNGGDDATAAAPSQPSGFASPPADPANVFAPSFDCRGAMGQVETLICNDNRLAQLDRRVTRAYAVARAGADATTRANVLEGQRQFLAARDACENAGCVARAYRDRLDDLQRTAASADDSCRAEIGAAAAARLVRQCMQVSPATHPPCNAANSCAMIQSEIDRSCAMFDDGDDIPGFCRR